MHLIGTQERREVRCACATPHIHTYPHTHTHTHMHTHLQLSELGVGALQAVVVGVHHIHLALQLL